MAVDVRENLLDAAQSLAQTRGYNAFSYRDLAERVGIRTASIHYHFKTKGDLGKALLERYRTRMLAGCQELRERHRSPRKRLAGLIEQFQSKVTTGGTACLCGLLAGEYATLPDDMQAELRRFFVSVEEWLAELLEEGRREGEFRFEGDAGTQAQALFAALQGALLAAAALRDPDRFRSAAERLVAGLVQ